MLFKTFSQKPISLVNNLDNNHDKKKTRNRASPKQHASSPKYSFDILFHLELKGHQGRHCPILLSGHASKCYHSSICERPQSRKHVFRNVMRNAKCLAQFTSVIFSIPGITEGSRKTKGLALMGDRC